jgi:hemerythrin-like domain-containing protein
MLHQDHDKVKSLFEQLEATGEDEESRRERLFSTLFRELDLHAEAEERYFYSRLKNNDDTREIVLESLAEHKTAKRLLAELDAMDKGTPEWTGKCRTLAEEIERHVEVEEQELFPLAQKVIGDEEAAGIAEDIESFKEEHSELEPL